MILALSGWQMNEITSHATDVIQITVQGKQNSIIWSYTPDIKKPVKS